MELTDDIRATIKGLLTAKPQPGISHRRIIGGGAKRRGCGASLWPFKSDALGVGVDQIDQAEAHNRAHGVPVEYDRQTGAAIVTGPGQYLKAARAGGLFTGRDGYGPPDTPTGKQAVRAREEAKQRLFRELTSEK